MLGNAQANRELIAEYVEKTFDYETNGGTDRTAHVRRLIRRELARVNAKVIANTYEADSRDKAVLSISNIEDFANVVMDEVLKTEIASANDYRRDCVHFDMG